ncbi:Oxidoreductase, short-chain dehydrogenase/reductase family [Olavius sp. associated proteobacterium Delta 1]|nr:Oxidoreductase, short-chain dehydrogenase/reductase family [Olavius sp. associated proteobacterium Delta 1]
MKGQFSGKHVLVTGGGRGIGFEIARHFAQQGARMTIFDNVEDLLNDAAGTLTAQDYEVHPYRVDVSRQPDVLEAVDAAEEIAPIDILINNAGIASETPFLQIAAAEWKKIIDVNLTGMFFVAQAVCKKMAARNKGVVINMSSKNGMAGEFGYAHYDASKGGIIALTRTMALELAHVGIRVNAVCPGYLVTPMSAEIDPPEFVENFVDRYIPLNRYGKVEDVAPMFLFLAGDGASFITGQVFVIDGGQLAGQKAGAELLAKMAI